jgi:hypothetical protein
MSKLTLLTGILTFVVVLAILFLRPGIVEAELGTDGKGWCRYC